MWASFVTFNHPKGKWNLHAGVTPPKKCWMWSVKGCSIGKHLDNLKHGGGFKRRTVSRFPYSWIWYVFFHRWLECAMWKMEGGRIRGQSTFCWLWMGTTNKGRILWFLRYFHLIRVRFSFATFPVTSVASIRCIPLPSQQNPGHKRINSQCFQIMHNKKEPVNYDWFPKSSRNAYLLAGPNRYTKNTQKQIRGKKSPRPCMCLSPSGPLSSCLWTWKAVADFWLTKHACLELLVLFTKSRCEHTLGVIFNQDVSGKWKFWRKKQDPR